MIHTKDHKTGYLFDPWDYMGPKRRKIMEQSWAGLFREHILQELPVNKIARYFTERFGRPTKELYMALGVIILQQSPDLTDDETLCQLAFSEQWHYVLDITSVSDNATYDGHKGQGYQVQIMETYTESEYDRKTGVKNLRVRGMEAVRFCATLKAVSINIFRATAVRNAKISPKPIRGLARWCIYRPWVYVKEQYCALLSNLDKIFSESTFSTGFLGRSAI